MNYTPTMPALSRELRSGRKLPAPVIGADILAFGVALIVVPGTTNLGLLTVLFVILGAEC